MKPRITIASTKEGELEILVNESGRDLLVKELRLLSKKNDHFHFGPEGFEMEVPVQTRPYRDGEQVHEWGKFLYRPDDWDAEYFPHVLQPKVTE